ncbi:hypothetical protein TTHERM_00339639 (macronuclear) [Tetrahymena thermophila SB210]|uniref:Uncharacterized protein n=1 Tax=Tetrahymena thermophila (strain SB210) TaxID=312017 RepID=A4VDP0_TETTS|nr:hypothetical protein TTHERM_00339639 [Tetrahymena thermophila SB210]EDK31646.2 hypothetical protein TTHERM_00339639 [Tetrahymena thermophila SB210]|eukprot:XP_001470835.2 hypothetical protein TTHERM_00339639 [Tetrahymena thermophila SB210]
MDNKQQVEVESKSHLQEDLDKYLFADNHFNGQNSSRVQDDSEREFPNHIQQVVYDESASQNGDQQISINPNKIHQQKQQFNEVQQQEIYENNENFNQNQPNLYNNDRSYSQSNLDDDSCIESKSLQNYNKENKEKLKIFQMQKQSQQNFNMNTLQSRQNVEKDNMNYLQSSLNYCNKTKDEIQEIIEQIPYPDQLSMTSISNSTHSYIGSTPQRNLLDNADFRQSKKSMKRGSLNRFNNEIQKMAQYQSLQNGKKQAHSKTEEDNHDIALNWSKSNVRPGDQQNIFPQVLAPSIELSNENSMILKMMQQNNSDMNQVQKINLATFGGFDTRNDEDLEDELENYNENSRINQDIQGQIDQQQKRLQQYQNINHYNYNSNNTPYELGHEDLQEDHEYYIDDHNFQQQQRQFEQKSQKNSSIIEHNKNYLQSNNISNNNMQNNSKSLNVIDKSRSQNYSMQEDQINAVAYQNNSQTDNSYYGEKSNYQSQTLQQQYQQQKMHYSNNNNGHSQVNYSDNQMDASCLSTNQQDQSVLQNLQQIQNQTINIMRKSDDDSAMRIQLSQLSMEKNQLMNRVQYLVQLVSKYEQEKIYQASQIEDLDQVLKLLKEKYKDNGNLEKLRGRELENERQNNKRLKQQIESKNEKIQSLLDEIQKLEQQREAYLIEFEKQREIKQNDQQMLQECQIQMQSIQEQNDQLLIKKEELETELQTRDFNLENMKQTYQQREKLLKNELSKQRMQYEKELFSYQQEIQILNKAKEAERQKLLMREESIQNDQINKQTIANLNEEIHELIQLTEKKDRTIELLRLELEEYKDEVRQNLLKNFSYWIQSEEFKNNDYEIMIEIIRSYLQELKYENEGLSVSVKQNNKQKIESVSEMRKLKSENYKLKDEVLNLSQLNDDKTNISGLSKGILEDKQETNYLNDQINQLNSDISKQRQNYESQIEKLKNEINILIEEKQNTLEKINFEMKILQNENDSLIQEVAQLKSMTQTGQNIINELENKLKKTQQQQLQQQSHQQKNISQSSQISLEQSASTQELELKNMQRIIEEEKKQLNEAQLKFEEDIQKKYEEFHLKEQELSKRIKNIQIQEEEIKQQKDLIKSQQQALLSINSDRSTKNTEKVNLGQIDQEQLKNLQTQLKREQQEKDLMKTENDHLIEQIENKEKEINQRDDLIKQFEEKCEKQERMLKEERKKLSEWQKENKVLLDNINQLKINYEKMQTQLQTNVSQLHQKQQEMQQQIKNQKQLSKKNKNLSQTNLELLSKIQNLNEQINNIEKERLFFNSQPSPIFHNKAKSCQYNNKGHLMQDNQKAQDLNRKRKNSTNSASSTKRDNKSLLNLIQNTFNNSSHNIRQSTLPEYPINDNAFDQPNAQNHKLNQLHLTHPSQNNLSLESFYHNLGGNTNVVNSSINHSNRQDSYKNLISSVMPSTYQNNRHSNRIPPSVNHNDLQGEETGAKSQVIEQKTNNATQKVKDDNLFSSQNHNFTISQSYNQNQLSQFNRNPSNISDTLQMLISEPNQQQKQQTHENQGIIQQNLTTKIETETTSRQKNQQINFDDNIHSNKTEQNTCERCNSQFQSLHEERQQIETMREQMENYELEFIQMKEFFVNKLKDVTSTIKDLELQKSILEKENQDLRTFKADYFTQIASLEHQKAIYERQVYNQIMAQKKLEQSKDEDNESDCNSNYLTITPEMLSAEETLDLMQEILRKVVKSNEMKKILLKSTDLKNLILAFAEHQQIQQQQQQLHQTINTQQSSIQQFNSTQCNSNYNNQSAPNLISNHQTANKFINPKYLPYHSYNSRTKKVGVNTAYLSNSYIDHTLSQNKNLSMLNPNETVNYNQNNFTMQNNSSSALIYPLNQQNGVNQNLFKANENKTQIHLQKLLDDQNKKQNYQNFSGQQHQNSKAYHSQYINPKSITQNNFYSQNPNQQVKQQIYDSNNYNQNNYLQVQNQNLINIPIQSQIPPHVMHYTKNNNQNLPLSSRRDKKQQFLSLDQNIIMQ